MLFSKITEIRLKFYANPYLINGITIAFNSYKNYDLEIIFKEDDCIMSLLNDTKGIREHSQINKEKTITNSFSLKYDKFHF